MTLDGGIRTCQWYDDGVTMHDHTAFDVMQFTGLRDRNGKEIYEGDVCRDFKYSGVKQKITYSDGCFRWGVEPLYIVINKLEVIGNIYENPQLM